MRFYLAQEVIDQVEGLNSEKTLKRWTNQVKENLGTDYFMLENIPFNRIGNKHPVTVYTLDDIKRFKQVADDLSQQPRNRKDLKKALTTAFASDGVVTQPKEAWEKSIEAIRYELKTMCHEDRRLLKAIQELNQKLSRLEATVKIAQENKPKLFRRK